MPMLNHPPPEWLMISCMNLLHQLAIGVEINIHMIQGWISDLQQSLKILVRAEPYRKPHRRLQQAQIGRSCVALMPVDCTGLLSNSLCAPVAVGINSLCQIAAQT